MKSNSGQTPAVFLDRDGTIIEDRHYLSKPEGVVLYPGAGEALRSLQEAGYKLFIITNQSGVGRGYFTLQDVDLCHGRLLELLSPFGLRFDKIYIAPEAPDQPSRGRKPSPQFLFDARDEFGVDLSKSWVIGDKMIDLECGWNAGVPGTILVRTGYGRKTEVAAAELLKRATVVDDLKAAASHILQFRLAPDQTHL